jgi:hypothetical protein
MQANTLLVGGWELAPMERTVSWDDDDSVLYYCSSPGWFSFNFLSHQIPTPPSPPMIAGQFTWSVKVTFDQAAVSYNGGSCFDANTVDYYDWNKLWGKARCGGLHQQDSDRFVWRRLQNYHTPANCGGMANCSGIQLATYSYDNGSVPYTNENWDLSKTFSTILQPSIAYILGMESFINGSVVHTLSSSNGALLESKTNKHSNLCTSNYQQGTVLGLYFGGTCTAPQAISVKYETIATTTVNPTQGLTRSPANTVSSTASPTTRKPSTRSPTTTRRPSTRRPTKKPRV